MLVKVAPTSEAKIDVGSFSAVSLASVLDQSVDCVKLVSLDGDIQYINENGLCALEIDNFSVLKGTAWADLWPDAVQLSIKEAYSAAATGRTVRFRAFCRTLKGAPRWWDVSVSRVTDQQGRLAGFLCVSRDVTLDQQSAEALKIAAAEMKHRLKNTYQMIVNLMLMTARGNTDNEDFAKAMADRLVALSRAQALFTDDEAPCALGELIPALVTPFGTKAGQVAVDALPAVDLTQPQADAIALVIGELAVNSAKHGAFAKGGTVQVSAASTAVDVTITWRELCALPIGPRARDGGQGLKLMDRIMRARDGSLVVDWGEQGITATLTIRLAG